MFQMIRKDKLCFVVVLLSSILLSCKNEKQDNKKDLKTTYGIHYNPIRRFIGLDTFNVNWVVYRELFVQEHLYRKDWYDKELSIENGRKNYHSLKTIWFQFDIPIIEGDEYTLCYYDSVKNILIDKMVGYSYHYVPDIYFAVGWRYHYYTNMIESVRGNVTKQQADSILYSWGVNRGYQSKSPLR